MVTCEKKFRPPGTIEERPLLSTWAMEELMFKQLSILIVGAAVLAFPRTGAAQSAPIHFSVGYQMLHIPDETYPVGLAAAVSGLEAGLTWAGEVGWSRDDQNEPGVDGTLTFVQYGAGPRWTAALPNARPFIQVLAGGVHTSANLTVNVLLSTIRTTRSCCNPGSAWSCRSVDVGECSARAIIVVSSSKSRAKTNSA